MYEAVVGPIPDGLEINHIDEDKKNNAPGNLEAVTHVENVRHGTGISRMKKGHHKPVNQYTLDGAFVATYQSIKEAGEKTPANRCNICWCCRGNLANAGGYLWEYA